VTTKRVTLASGATVEKMVPKPAEKPPAGQQGALGGVAAKPPAPGGSLGQLDSAPTGPLGPSAILSVATKVSISELKAGDYVRIIATNDVRTSAAIEASSVTIYDISNIPAEAASDPSQLPFSRTNDLPYLPTPTEPPASPAPGGVMPTPDAGTAPQPGSSTGAAATPPTTEPTAGGSVASPPSPTP